jgi:predicted transposase YdaD
MESDENLDDIVFSPAAMRHDGFFKLTFSQKEIAAGFFRERLPAPLVSAADWDSLRPLKDSHVGNDLAQAFSDLVFSVRLAGRAARIYLLFEHQSTPDSSMPLRMLEYIAAVERRHFEANGEKLPLPVVFPYLLHQGPAPWRQASRFQDIVDIPEGLADGLLPVVPKFDFPVLDLSRINPAEDVRDAQVRIILELMKRVRERRAAMDFARWLVGQQISRLILRLAPAIMTYLFGHPDSSPNALDIGELDAILNPQPELRRKTMTALEKLREDGIKEGIQKGRQEGRQEGREEGLWIGKIQMLEEMLGLDATTAVELESLPLPQLESRFRDLEARYARHFKKG